MKTRNLVLIFLLSLVSFSSAEECFLNTHQNSSGFKSHILIKLYENDSCYFEDCGLYKDIKKDDGQIERVYHGIGSDEIICAGTYTITDDTLSLKMQILSGLSASNDGKVEIVGVKNKSSITLNRYEEKEIIKKVSCEKTP